MIGAVKLGVAVAAAFAIGDQVGRGVANALIKDASPATLTGAAWGGRIAVFALITRVL